jgi:hypothetical protein
VLKIFCTAILTAITGLPSRPVPPPSRNPLKRVAKLMHELFFSTAEANDETCLTMAGVFWGSVGVLHSVVLHRRSTAMKSVKVRLWLLYCFWHYSSVMFSQSRSSSCISKFLRLPASLIHVLEACAIMDFFRRSDSGAGTLEHDHVGCIRSDPGKPGQIQEEEMCCL